MTKLYSYLEILKLGSDTIPDWMSHFSVDDTGALVGFLLELF